MKITTKNYYDDFIDLTINGLNETITTKKECLEIIENLEVIIFELREFAFSKKRTY